MCTDSQEGQELLGGEQLEKTRQQTAEAAADAQKSSPSKVKRTTTIAQTTSEVPKQLEKSLCNVLQPTKCTIVYILYM